MARQAKIVDIYIPVFDGVNFNNWKFRVMNLLEYKERNEPAIRHKLETEKIEDWKRTDLKAKTILISTVSDRQLEYLSDCTTTFEMMQKLENIYSTKSTALQIINRNKLDEVKLKDYENVENFFINFEKACNELKTAGGSSNEEEKMRYMIKALPASYSYIGDFIDLVPKTKEQLTY